MAENPYCPTCGSKVGFERSTALLAQLSKHETVQIAKDEELRLLREAHTAWRRYAKVVRLPQHHDSPLGRFEAAMCRVDAYRGVEVLPALPEQEA